MQTTNTKRSDLDACLIAKKDPFALPVYHQLEILVLNLETSVVKWYVAPHLHRPPTQSITISRPNLGKRAYWGDAIYTRRVPCFPPASSMKCNSPPAPASTGALFCKIDLPVHFRECSRERGGGVGSNCLLNFVFFAVLFQQ